MLYKFCELESLPLQVDGLLYLIYILHEVTPTIAPAPSPQLFIAIELDTSMPHRRALASTTVKSENSELNP